MIEDLRQTGVEKTLAIHEEVARILGNQSVGLPELRPFVQEPDLFERIEDFLAEPTFKERVGRKTVTVVLGNEGSEIKIKYRRKDASRAKIEANPTVPDPELAATASLFHTIVARVTGQGVFTADETILLERQKRTERMLEELGRADIVRASRKLTSLPGIGRK